jgi:hypothetical protein
VRETQVRAFVCQQSDAETDSVLIAIAEVDKPVSELIGILNVPAHWRLYSMRGI